MDDLACAINFTRGRFLFVVSHPTFLSFFMITMAHDLFLDSYKYHFYRRMRNQEQFLTDGGVQFGIIQPLSIDCFGPSGTALASDNKTSGRTNCTGSFRTLD